MSYWVKRVSEQNAKRLQLTQTVLEKELRKMYQEQSLKLYSDLNRVFLKMLSDTQTKGKIFLNDLYRTNNYMQLLNHFNQCSKAIGGKQLKITQKGLIGAYKSAQQVIQQFLPKGMIKPTFIVPSAVDTKNIINQVWCIDGKSFSDRVWYSKEKLVKALDSTLQEFLARGESPYVVSQEIVSRLAIDEYSAYRLARTETAHAQIQGAVDKYKSMGFTRGRFLAQDACDECMELDNQLFSLDQLETMIPLHPNCRCSFLLEE